MSSLLDGALPQDSELGAGLCAIERRSERCRPIAAELAELEARGELTCSVNELLPSYLHMFVNRIVRSAQRAHEYVLYDLLFSHYRSQAGRRRAESRAL